MSRQISKVRQRFYVSSSKRIKVFAASVGGGLLLIISLLIILLISRDTQLVRIDQAIALNSLSAGATKAVNSEELAAAAQSNGSTIGLSSQAGWSSLDKDFTK